MSFWAYLILILALLWILQIMGTYFQMQHYRRVLSRVTSESNEGYAGVGNAKARFGKGVILILVVDKNDTVVRALRMRGMTVFARFQEATDFVGMKLDELRGEGREGPYEAATMQAARRAVEQIDRIKTDREEGVAVS